VEQNERRSIFFKLAILWLGILLMGSFWLSTGGASNPIVMAVLPQAPREGEPVIATFKLSNPTAEELVTSYRFYADGEIVREGTATLAPRSSKVYQYAYENSLPLGSQLNFVVETESELGSFSKYISTPPYPPQVWSSFVSFASFSTTIMGSMATMSYYQGSFGNDTGWNIGFIASAVLVALLIFLELPISPVRGSAVAALGRLKVRLSTVTWILLIIFVGMVYTKIALIITGT
jgi:hypothetical protein